MIRDREFYRIRARVINEIYAIMLQAYQCKRRWKNIKTAYIKNKKKLETGTANGSNSAWSLSANVSFLDTVRVDHKNNAA